jgi:hypothetical protein
VTSQSRQPQQQQQQQHQQQQQQQQQQHKLLTSRRLPIVIEDTVPVPAGSVAELHAAVEQRLLHVVLTKGVLSREIKALGISYHGDQHDGIALADVGRLARRLFPSLNSSISCASVAPTICGITEDAVKEEDCDVLLLAMVYSSFVADVMGRAEQLSSDVLHQGIVRLQIAESAACEAVTASAVAGCAGWHSNELFCLWFVRMRMRIILGKIHEVQPESFTEKQCSEELLRMLRLHSNSAVSHLRLVNNAISGSSREPQVASCRESRSTGVFLQASKSSVQRELSSACSDHPNSARSPMTTASPIRCRGRRAPQSLPDSLSSNMNCVEGMQREVALNSARLCISANLHLIRFDTFGDLQCLFNAVCDSFLFVPRQF